jgi:hypothetical protein
VWIAESSAARGSRPVFCISVSVAALNQRPRAKIAVHRRGVTSRLEEFGSSGCPRDSTSSSERSKRDPAHLISTPAAETGI